MFVAKVCSKHQARTLCSVERSALGIGVRYRQMTDRRIKVSQVQESTRLRRWNRYTQIVKMSPLTTQNE